MKMNGLLNDINNVIDKSVLLYQRKIMVCTNFAVCLCLTNTMLMKE